MRIFPFLTVVLVLAFLTAGCGGGSRAADDAVKAVSKLFDNVVELLGNKEGQNTRSALCAAISVKQGDLPGAVSSFGEGAVRARSAATDLEEFLEDPDVKRGLLNVSCI